VALASRDFSLSHMARRKRRNAMGGFRAERGVSVECGLCKRLRRTDLFSYAL